MNKKRVGIVAAFLLAVFGVVPANAAEENTQEYGSLAVGGVDIVSDGEVTGEAPENVSYDSANNILTLTNCVLDVAKEPWYWAGIDASGMGDDFTIHLEGENVIKGTTSDEDYVYSIVSSSNLTIEGPGTLNLVDTATMGINYSGDLRIEGCTINITGNPDHLYYFYGMSGSTDFETDTYIIDSQINISNSMESGSEYANTGIDVQDGNLAIDNSEISIELTNGNIFGLVAGQTEEYGGRLSIENSLIKCITNTDMNDAGNRYNHNMYFYELANYENLYYYIPEGDSFVRKDFDEVFEFERYYSGRYDSDTSTIISSTPISEYCNHEWNDGEVTKEASCAENGEMTYTCTVCGETKTDVITKLGHEWNSWTVITDATCTEEGTRVRTCSRCNERETEIIPELGHELVTETITEPSCTEEGLQRNICSRCGVVIGEEIIPATGHDYEWTINKEATFHEDGLKTGVCNICGYTTTETIPQLSLTHEHDFSGKEEIVKPATCTEEGSKNIYCVEPDCGEYVSEVIPMTDHTPGKWETVKEASCSENGMEECKCTVCGTVIETRSLDKLEHKYGEWGETTPATCTEPGIETAECAVCGEKAVREISPLGHEFEEWNVIKDASCIEDGEETSICIRCGELGTREIKATGHSYGVWMTTKEATVTEEGERQAVCTECGDVKKEIIPKLTNSQTILEGTESDKSVKPAVPEKETVAINNPKTGDKIPMLLYLFTATLSVAIVLVAGKKKYFDKGRTK